MIPDGYRMERGMLWPAADVGAAAAIDDVAELETACRHCTDFGVAVQAGGCCGVWPRALGERFRAVYTFEPDPVNFRCLAANAPAEHVYKFNAALGGIHRVCDLDRRPENVGAHRLADAPGGRIPTLRIDDLALPRCDLVCLDVEGTELAALQGAAETIGACRPVILIEEKGLSEHYGIAAGSAEAWLRESFGYRVAERLRRDLVLVPA